ncbi:hypothetical protein KC921_04840 [Candidatus Woesebacteria bacterium]|nr:hypothetical protein [Candidatus Woesebacteria bacterium]
MAIEDQINPEASENTVPTEVGVVSFFSEMSGLGEEQINKSLGDWMLQQVVKTPENVIHEHFAQGDPRGQQLLNQYSFYKQKIPEKARALFFRDLLTFRYQSDPAFKQYFDTLSGGSLKEVLSVNSKALVMRELQQYEDGPEPNFPDSLGDAERCMIIQSAGSPETAAAQILHVQEGLNDALRISKELFSTGRIPIFRILFFSEPLKKNEFLAENTQAQQFMPQNPNTDISTYSLQDVIRHTDAKREGSPLDSWTFAPPNSDWRFGLKKLARVPAVLMISEVDPGEMLYSKRFGGFQDGIEDHTMFDYVSDSVIETGAPLDSLSRSGKSGVFMPNEAEATMWGPLKNCGLIDLGP